MSTKFVSVSTRFCNHLPVTDICTYNSSKISCPSSSCATYCTRGDVKDLFLVHRFWDFKLQLCDPMSRGKLSQPQKRRGESSRKRSSLGACQVTCFPPPRFYLPEKPTASHFTPLVRNPLSTLERGGPFHNQAIITLCLRVPKAHGHFIAQNVFSSPLGVPKI